MAGDFAKSPDLRPTLPTGHEIVSGVLVAGSDTKRAILISQHASASADVGEVAIVLRALMTLQAKGAEWRQSIDALRACFSCDDTTSTARQSRIAVSRVLGAAAVSDAVNKLAVAYAELMHHVPTFNRVLFGDTIESIGELALRGEMFLVMRCLYRLRELMPPASCSPPSMDLSRAVLRDYFDSVDDVIAFAELEFCRIPSLWLQLRRTPQREAAPTSFESDYARLHRAAVRIAEHQMNDLLRHPRFGRFLEAGVRHRQRPEVQLVCSRMAIALQFKLTAELDLAILHAQATRLEAWSCVIHAQSR